MLQLLKMESKANEEMSRKTNKRPEIMKTSSVTVKTKPKTMKKPK